MSRLTKEKYFGLSIIFLILAILFALYSFAVILDFGVGHKVPFCPSNAQPTCGCNDYVGGVLRCDNSYFSNDPDKMIENSVTLDSCVDGADVTPYEGADLYDFYEFVRDISREDLNGSASNPYDGGLEDSFLRAKDDIKITVTFLCSVDGDAYNILYKNNTNPAAAWEVLTYGTCYSTDYTNYLSQLVSIDVTKKLDDIPGNHTIRGVISYSSEHPYATCGEEFDDPSYSDTDDMVFGVDESIDFEPPDIVVITPVNGSMIELQDNLVIPIIINVTDRTNVSYVNASLIFNNVSTPLNLTREGTIYSANITNLSSLGFYEVVFFANDTIETNTTRHTINHVNNYTKINFYLKNDVFITINSPGFRSIYSNSNVSLDFRIVDSNTPFIEVYYLLNDAKTNLNESKYLITADNSSVYVNNSAVNLSQSFVFDVNTFIQTIDLYIKRVGDDTNSTILLVNDLSGPYGNVLASAIVSSVDNVSFEWKRVTLNQSVNITLGDTYWVTILSQNETNYLLIGVNDSDSYSDGEFFANQSHDLSMKVYDLYAYNSTLVSAEGLNTLRVCENNSLSSVKCAYTEYYVDTAPPYFSALSYTAQVELGSLQSIILDVKDAISTISNAVINFNNTNISMNYTSISGGKRYSISLNLSIVSGYNFSFYANDSSGWQNSTGYYNFSVNDTLPPILGSISNYPNTTDEIDPNSTIYFNFTLSDYSSINTILLQYRPNTTSTWSNVSAALISNSLYTANFTPAEETTYYYRIFANDSFGSLNYSSNYSINIAYERYWGYSPPLEDYTTAFMNIGEIKEIYNFTVSNTGDVPLLFNISPYSSNVVTLFFSNQTFILGNDSNKTVFVNSTAPPIKNLPYVSKSVISCLSGCALSSAIVGSSVVVLGDGPYLDLKIVYVNENNGEETNTIYSLPYYDGRTYLSPHKFRAIVENEGTLAADNITLWFNFTNTSLWIMNITNPENLTSNFSLSAPGQANNIKIIDIIFYIEKPDNLSILYDLNVSTTFMYNESYMNNSQNAKINVTKYNPDIILEVCSNGIDDNNDGQIDEGCSTSTVQSGGSGNTETSTPSIGGGNNNAAGSGLGGGTTLSYNLTASFDKTVDLFRGTNKTISVDITNIYKNKYFSDIRLSVLGYYQNHIAYAPKIIDILLFNETKTINITFNAPSYIGYSVNKVMLSFDYLVVSNGLNSSLGDKSSNAFDLTLIVNEVSREESFLCLEQSIGIVKNATSEGYNTKSLKEKLDLQKSAVFSLDFTKAKQICDDVKSDFEKLLSYSLNLAELEKNINQSIMEGYSLSEVLRLLEMSKSQFNNGEYQNLENSIKDIESAYLLQIKLEDANLFKRFRKFLLNNLHWIILSILLFSLLSYYSYKQISKVIVKNKILDLEKEKIEVGASIKNLQQKYYSEKSVSPDYFNLHIEKNNERMAKIEGEILHYTSLSSSLSKNARKSESFIDKEARIKESIAELQKKYYLDKSIDKKKYEKSLSEYNDSLIRVKKDILLSRKKEDTSKDKNLTDAADSILKKQLI